MVIKLPAISLLFHLLFFPKIFCQTTWSITTDFNAIRSFKADQQFWSVGHTIRGEAHLTTRDGPYIWVSYFSPGKFKNDLVADAKSAITLPQNIAFRNKANMSLKQVNIGWKHYFKGDCNQDKTWSLYGLAGFGIIGGRIRNEFQPFVDTSLYTTPVWPGESRFKRLTIDLGAGWETLVTGDIFIYNEIKAWIPTSDYPNKFLLNNSYVPLIGSFHFVIRVYFQ